MEIQESCKEKTDTGVINFDNRYDEHGIKKMIHPEKANMAKAYYKWHRGLGQGLYMLDIDAIEWRIEDGKKRAVGVFELTSSELNANVGKKYLQAIIDRLFDSMSADCAIQVANGLKTKAYATLFKDDTSEFWVYDLNNGRDGRWIHYSNPQQYEGFLLSLG